MKRFYSQATAAAASDVEALDATDGHTVLLDGKPIRTQTRARFVVPTPALAQAVAEEWAAQEETVVPESMPMMTFASTAIDRVVPQVSAVAGDAAGYAASDLLCYRADAPEELVRRQEAGWQPLLDWAEEAYGARLKVTRGILPVAQDNSALMLLARAVGGYDAFRLAGLHVMTTTMGSLVLALAVTEGRLTPEDAFALSVIDETFQAEKWGDAEEAVERRRRLRAEVTDAARFLALLD